MNRYLAKRGSPYKILINSTNDMPANTGIQKYQKYGFPPEFMPGWVPERLINNSFSKKCRYSILA
ncbi:MAG: hypothetical protein ACE5EH_12040, partial [Gammaproteobacteria bacterium]